MTRDETFKILAILTAAYPNAYKNMTDDEVDGVVAVWAMQFATTPVEIVFLALNKAISGCKFPPTISEIKQRITALHWEAYRFISSSEAYSELMEQPFESEELDQYKRIYEATKPYDMSTNELSLHTMLGSGSMKFLE